MSSKQKWNVKEARKLGYSRYFRNKEYGSIGTSKYFWNTYYVLKDLGNLKLDTINPFSPSFDQKSHGYNSVCFSYSNIDNKVIVYAHVSGTNVNQELFKDILVENPVYVDDGYCGTVKVFSKKDIKKVSEIVNEKMIAYLDKVVDHIDEDALPFKIKMAWDIDKKTSLASKLLDIANKNSVKIPKPQADSNGNVTFNVTCTMKERWVPYFCAMLKRMQDNGNAGHSSSLAFYADGDGDFRPKFDIATPFEYPKTLKRYNDKGVIVRNLGIDVEEFFDAG